MLAHAFLISWVIRFVEKTQLANEIFIILFQHLNQLSAQHELYGETCRESSRQIVVLKSFEIIDKLEASEFNKLLHLYSSSTLPRQSNANMFSLKCVNLRPDGGRGPIPEETNVSLSLQPLRLNIDQDTLLFIVDFFSSLFPALSDANTSPSPVPLIAAQQTVSGMTPSLGNDESRVMTIRYKKDSEVVEIQAEVGIEADEDFEDSREETQSNNFDNDNELDDEEEDGSSRREQSQERSISPGQTSSQGSSGPKSRQPYIRTFIFAKNVPIRIDYSAKYLDLSQVNYFLNFLSAVALSVQVIRKMWSMWDVRLGLDTTTQTYLLVTVSKVDV